jgi:hypothetical protein
MNGGCHPLLPHNLAPVACLALVTQMRACVMLLRWTLCGTADTKAWEVDTLRGHVNNVSCVMFHARSVRPAENQADMDTHSMLFCTHRSRGWSGVSC